MKVLKPFIRDGVRFRRDDKVPADLDKATIAHYQRNGMIEKASTSASTKPAGPSTTTTPASTPAPRTRQPGPAERKPAQPSETKPAGPANAGVQGVLNPSVVEASSPDSKSETLAVGDAALGHSADAADPVKDRVDTAERAPLPLG